MLPPVAPRSHLNKLVSAEQAAVYLCTCLPARLPDCTLPLHFKKLADRLHKRCQPGAAQLGSITAGGERAKVSLSLRAPRLLNKSWKLEAQQDDSRWARLALELQQPDNKIWTSSNCQPASQTRKVRAKIEQVESICKAQLSCEGSKLSIGTLIDRSASGRAAS